MGMPCQVNSILKLKRSHDFPEPLTLGHTYQATKPGYRILPMDVPIQLVDEQWLAHADVVIRQLTWEDGATHLRFTVHRCYAAPFCVKADA
ncbi:MAG: DUF2584 family protein [Synechococcales cyanobacterium M58_A2018_015]|nr:DUF2584 family protein [Synechococcales cyanobacterium M58_A2018_015]